VAGSRLWYGTVQHVPLRVPACHLADKPGDIRGLVARADKLWANHKQQSHDLVANMDIAEEQPAGQTAAVQKKKPRAQGDVFLEDIRRAGTAASGGGLVVSGSGSVSGGLTHSE
jgi:hypothetical protein